MDLVTRCQIFIYMNHPILSRLKDIGQQILRKNVCKNLAYPFFMTYCTKFLYTQHFIILLLEILLSWMDIYSQEDRKYHNIAGFGQSFLNQLKSSFISWHQYEKLSKNIQFLCNSTCHDHYFYDSVETSSILAVS